MTEPGGAPPVAPFLEAALKPFRWLGIRARLLFVLTFLAVFGVVVATIFQLSTLADFTVASMIKDAEQIDQQLAPLIERALDQRPELSTSDALHESRVVNTFLQASIGPYSYVLYIAIADPSGRVLASSSPSMIGEPIVSSSDPRRIPNKNAMARLFELQKQRDYEVVQAVPRADGRNTVMHVGLASSFVRDALKPTVERALWLAAIALALAILMAVFLTHITTRPINRLLDAIERLGRGEKVELQSDVNADHEMVRLFRTFDIAATRLAENRAMMEDRNRQLAALLDGLEDGMIMVERSGRVALVNPTACRILGVERDAFVGRDLAESIGGGHPLVTLFRRAVLETGTGELGEVHLDLGEQRDRYLLQSYPVFEGNELRAVVLTLRNSDSLRKLATLMDESHRVIAWGQVALGVAHEIKNPLQAMSINLELAREKLMKSATDVDLSGPMRNLGVVGQQIRRLDGVVNDFLRFARMNRIEREPVQLNAVVAEIVSLLRGTAEAEGTQVRFTPKPGIPEVWGDRKMLYQAILNVVQNALQAGPHKGPIEVEVRPGPGRGVTVTVEDHGRGIRRSAQDQVFDLFYTTKENGSGIGLAIVQRTSQLHDGKITLESDEGEGTRFEIWLPHNVPLQVNSPGGADGRHGESDERVASGGRA